MSREKPRKVAEVLAKKVERGEIRDMHGYRLTRSLPSWYKGPDRDIHGSFICISDRSNFVLAHLVGVDSTEHLSRLLGEFDIHAALEKKERYYTDALVDMVENNLTESLASADENVEDGR